LPLAAVAYGRTSFSGHNNAIGRQRAALFDKRLLAAGGVAPLNEIELRIDVVASLTRCGSSLVFSTPYR